MPNDLLKLAVAYNVPDQTAIIESLVRESGLLRTIPFQKASHGLFHKYKVKQSLPSGGFRRINGSIVPHSTTDQVRQEDLRILTDVQQEDKAICQAYPGGVQKYFADEAPAFVEGLGQTAAKQFLYGTTGPGNADGFKGLRQHAVEASNTIDAGGTSGVRTTILAVRWRPGICCGLYNETAFEQGKLIMVTPLNGGEPVMAVVDTSTGAVKPVYQALYEAYMGLLVADSGFVAAYVSVSDETGHKPTASNMDKLIDLCKGDSAGQTFIYASRTARRLLWELKDSKMQTTGTDMNYDNRIERWNGVPVILDENLSVTETI